MNTPAYTFNERDLRKDMTMKIELKRGFLHRRLERIGLWVMCIGARIAGIGNVEVLWLDSELGGPHG